MLNKRGKWYADWSDGNSHSGKRHRKAFSSKRAAAAFQQKMRNAQPNKPRIHTVKSLPKAVVDSADISAITQVVLRERESRDMGRWEQMRECFWPDSVVRISWFRGNGPDFVTGSIDMARRGIPAKHRLGPVLVTLAGDRAIASLTAIIDLPVKLQDVEGTLSTHARFLYRAERRSERWRIFGFDAIYMRDELTPSIPGEHISISHGEVQGFRASYQMLSYYLRSQGYDIDPNLAGEDRADLVEELNRELSSWMAASAFQT